MNLEELVNYTAVFLGRSYYLVDPGDIAQELWVWLSGHTDKVVEWNDDELGDAKLRLALKRAGIKFAKREQEARSHVTGTAGEGHGVPLWEAVPEETY